MRDGGDSRHRQLGAILSPKNEPMAPMENHGKRCIFINAAAQKWKPPPSSAYANAGHDSYQSKARHTIGAAMPHRMQNMVATQHPRQNAISTASSRVTNLVANARGVPPLDPRSVPGSPYPRWVMASPVVVAMFFRRRNPTSEWASNVRNLPSHIRHYSAGTHLFPGKIWTQAQMRCFHHCMKSILGIQSHPSERF